MQVTVYTTPTCGYCHQVKAYLTQKDVAFVEKNVAADAAAATEMVRLSGQQGVPVVLIDGQVVVGFNVPQLDALLSGAAARPRIGAAIADAHQILEKRGRQPIRGVYLGRVNAEGPADQAGLQPNDVIVEIDGRSVGSADELEGLLPGLSRGKPVAVVIIRDNRRVEAQLVL